MLPAAEPPALVWLVLAAGIAATAKGSLAVTTTAWGFWFLLEITPINTICQLPALPLRQLLLSLPSRLPSAWHRLRPFISRRHLPPHLLSNCEQYLFDGSCSRLDHAFYDSRDALSGRRPQGLGRASRAAICCRPLQPCSINLFKEQACRRCITGPERWEGRPGIKQLRRYATCACLRRLPPDAHI